MVDMSQQHLFISTGMWVHDPRTGFLYELLIVTVMYTSTENKETQSVVFIERCNFSSRRLCEATFIRKRKPDRVNNPM